LVTLSSGTGRRSVSLQRRRVERSTDDEGVLKLKFENRWEGPGDAFQTIVESMGGLEVRVTPADGSPAFDEPEYVRVKALRISS
jgi:hypothetical protein